MVHDRQRVIPTQHHAGLLQLGSAGAPGRVQQPIGQLRQLWQVAPDELALAVELFALAYGIEDSEPGLSIAAAGTDPLPAAVVGGQIKVIEVLGKVSLAPTPVDSEVFHQKTACHHAQAVVHIAGLIDLGHRGVHQRVAGPPLAPGGKQRIGWLAMFPLDSVVLAPVGTLGHMREVGQNRKIEVSPDQFAEPDSGAPAALALPLQGKGSELTDRCRAKAQVHAEVARTLDGREVARFVVAVHALVEVFHQVASTRCTGADSEFAQIGFLKAQG